MNTSSQNPRYAEPTRKSVVILFAIGAIMLVAPLSTVLAENSACRADAAACNHSEDYRYLVSAFPYIMLLGGIVIAYNMKRISDHASHAASMDEDDDGENDQNRSFESY